MVGSIYNSSGFVPIWNICDTFYFRNIEILLLKNMAIVLPDIFGAENLIKNQNENQKK